MLVTKNTHHRGKDHYITGLKFDWLGFYQTRKYVVICIYLNHLIQTIYGDQLYCDLPPYGEYSLVIKVQLTNSVENFIHKI